ncbi:MAG TPA: hypothetical protein VF625_00115 [Longimicrobium sp.]
MSGLSFDLVAENRREESVHPCTVFVAAPVVRGGAWVTFITWKGFAARPIKGYGATSLQSLRLALDIFDMILEEHSEEWAFSQDGQPFHVPGVPKHDRVGSSPGRPEA